MKTKLIIGILIVGIILISGCSQQQFAPIKEKIRGFCGDEICGDDERCGSCERDCGVCKLEASEVNINLEWKQIGKISQDKGDVYGFIELISNKIGMWKCTSSIDNEREGIWLLSSSDNKREGFFGFSKELAKEHNILFCCSTYSADGSYLPNFCKNIVLLAYN